MVYTPTNVADVIRTLEALDCRPVRRGRGYLAHCPAHDDSTRSLSVGAGDEQAVLLHCFAGCRFEDVAAVLAGERPPVPRSAPSRRRRGQGRAAGRVVARYEYRDEAGELLYAKMRLAPKSFRFEGPDGRPGLPDGARRVPYRLPELSAAPPASLAIVVEGEKDADRLAAHGLRATCADGGAGVWPEVFAAHFEGLHVAILPDNDDAGRQHAQTVAHNLVETAASVKVVALPGLPEKGDASDYLDGAGDVGELLAAIYDAPIWQPPAKRKNFPKLGQFTDSKDGSAGPTLATGAEIRALWWALNAGRMEERPPNVERLYRRRLATLQDSDNPLVAEAWAAVKVGERPADRLTRLLLQEAEGWAGPGHIRALIERGKARPQLREQLKAQRLDLTPGEGEWPKKPHHRGHAAETGAVITIRAQESAVAKLITPNWRDSEEHPACPACQYERTQRQARQVLHELYRQEGALWLLEIGSEANFRRFADRLRKRRQRGTDAVYRAYPLPDGAYVVLHNQAKEGGAPLSNDRGQLFRALHEAANATPEGRLISSSAGWGGPWQGTRGDGRVKLAEQEGHDVEECIQLWTTASVEKTAEALGVELHFDTSYVVALEAVEVYSQLVSAGISLRERRTNRSGLRAFLEFLGADVTYLAQETPGNPLYEKRDKRPAKGASPAAPEPPPLPSALFGPPGAATGARP